MKTNKAKAIGLIASGALVASASPVAQVAFADERGASDAETPKAEQAARAEAAQSQVMIENVQGTFGWNQGVSVDTEVLKKALYLGAKHLCGSQIHDMLYEAESAAVQVGAPIGHIRVTGDVNNEFTASVEEFEAKAPVNKIMGCTCFGNPSDGRASANASVSGFELAALINEAGPVDGANTITFTSSDGYVVSLPLSYVSQRYSVIVTVINGEAAGEAIGHSNQLWLGATSARSFARDIVRIEITKEQEAPAVPGISAQANQPNVGVLQGGSAS